MGLVLLVSQVLRSRSGGWWIVSEGEELVWTFSPILANRS